MLDVVEIAGKSILPLVEGGKGVSATNGKSAGAWAASGGLGTVSAVNADSYDNEGQIISQIYQGKTRIKRHEELVKFGIEGGVTQAKIAHDIASGKGLININILWEMGGAQRVLEGILKRTKGIVNGVTCGAGMPYKLAEITAKFGVFYYPIVSSARAFKILFKRAYYKFTDNLGGVVYEDPWLAGGHNGLSNSEDPEKPQKALPRVRELRKLMSEIGLAKTIPIIIAGGVWRLDEWEDCIENPDLGSIAFQFGTRPLLTRESPIPEAWKKRLLSIKKGEVFLHRFSPTGFYASAVKNDFINELESRSQRQVIFSNEKILEKGLIEKVAIGNGNRQIFVTAQDKNRINSWIREGYTEGLKTPDNTMIFVSLSKAREIRKDQIDCMGCLSQCKFSNWSDNEKHTTGKKVDPRSFCIQKTLQDIVHDKGTENQLMFAGHNAWRFSQDPFYSNGFVPTVKQLVDRILSGA